MRIVYKLFSFALFCGVIIGAANAQETVEGVCARGGKPIAHVTSCTVNDKSYTFSFVANPSPDVKITGVGLYLIGEETVSSYIYMPQSKTNSYVVTMPVDTNKYNSFKFKHIYDKNIKPVGAVPEECWSKDYSLASCTKQQ